MRLADFILRDMDLILAEWEEFAADQMPAAASMTELELRDHAPEILRAVAKDVATPQTEAARAQKGKGRAPRPMHAPETAAQTHAVLRARSGFDINQLAAEYRALRASVLRHYVDACRPREPHVEDVMRFNESIDQALAESIDFFSKKLEQARNLLMGMVGHDMRAPLHVIQMTSRHLSALNAGEDVSEAASRLIESGTQMRALLDDLVDFSRTELGLGIRIEPTEVDLAALCADELRQARAAYPDRELDLRVEGDIQGSWDPRRLRQVLANLISNAINHGAPEEPIRIRAVGEEADVRIDVRNVGAPVEASTLDRVVGPPEHGFEPEEEEIPREGLGLGLFIVRAITDAHGGRLEGRSEEGETVFSVRLPRRPEP